MTFNRRLFSSSLCAHMDLHNLTGREAAKQAGVSASTISRLTSGKEAPDMETFATLVAWMGVDSTAFFESASITGDDRWARLYDALVALDVPSDLTEAMITVVKVIRGRHEESIV